MTFDNFFMMKRWLENRNAGKTLSDFFVKCGFKTVAIYGAGDLGRLAYNELKDSAVKVTYFIDRNAMTLNNVDGIPVITPAEFEKLHDTEIVIITASGGYDSICRLFAQNIPEIGTVALYDVVCEC